MTLHMGDQIKIDGFAEVSSAGCLVHFDDEPERVLLLGCAHGLVRRAAVPGDVISARATGDKIGKLETWTTFRQIMTADIALVEVNASRVSSRAANNEIIKLPPAPVRRGDTLHMLGGNGSTHVAETDAEAAIPVSGEGWSFPKIVYTNQILCWPMFTNPGDSGSIVVNDAHQVVGMVVGAVGGLDNASGRQRMWTVVTPFSSIRRHPDFDGRLLSITP